MYYNSEIKWSYIHFILTRLHVIILRRDGANNVPYVGSYFSTKEYIKLHMTLSSIHMDKLSQSLYIERTIKPDKLICKSILSKTINGHHHHKILVLNQKVTRPEVVATLQLRLLGAIEGKLAADTSRSEV